MKNIEPYKVNCPQCGSDKTEINDKNIKNDKKYLKAFLLDFFNGLFSHYSATYSTELLKEDLFINCSNCDYEDKFVPNKEYRKYKRMVNRRKNLPITLILLLVLAILLIIIRIIP